MEKGREEAFRGRVDEGKKAGRWCARGREGGESRGAQLLWIQSLCVECFAFKQMFIFCTSSRGSAETSGPIAGLLIYVGEGDDSPLHLRNHR